MDSKECNAWKVPWRHRRYEKTRGKDSTSCSQKKACFRCLSTSNRSVLHLAETVAVSVASDGNVAAAGVVVSGGSNLRCRRRRPRLRRKGRAKGKVGRGQSRGRPVPLGGGLGTPEWTRSMTTAETAARGPTDGDQPFPAGGVRAERPDCSVSFPSRPQEEEGPGGPAGGWCRRFGAKRGTEGAERQRHRARTTPAAAGDDATKDDDVLRRPSVEKETVARQPILLRPRRRS